MLRAPSLSAVPSLFLVSDWGFWSAERGAGLAGGGQRHAAAALPARRDAADAGLHPQLVRAGEHALLPVALARCPPAETFPSTAPAPPHPIRFRQARPPRWCCARSPRSSTTGAGSGRWAHPLQSLTRCAYLLSASRPAFSRILVLIIGLVRPPQELRSYRELTAAEFDALQASAPAIRDGCLRQLRAAMGDTRGGRQLLEEWEADRWALTETE